MSQSGITLGPDIKITVRDSDGIYLVNDIIQEFSYKWDAENRKVKTLGKVYPITLIDNVSGNFSVVKNSSVLEQYFVTKYQRYTAGVTIPDIFIQCLITNPSGSVSTYNFNQVVMNLDNGGSYTRDSEVIMSISWQALNMSISNV